MYSTLQLSEVHILILLIPWSRHPARRCVPQPEEIY